VSASERTRARVGGIGNDTGSSGTNEAFETLSLGSVADEANRSRESRISGLK
jgi:hypothetical protein